MFAGNDRDKAEKVLQKLCQINCISNQAVIEWACAALEGKDNVTEWSEVSLEFDIILQALQRESALKWLTVTMY